MTPLDKAREAAAAVEKATAGTLVAQLLGRAKYAREYLGGVKSPTLMEEAASALTKAAAEHERLADRVAKLEGLLTDWEAGRYVAQGKTYAMDSEMGSYAKDFAKEVRTLLTPAEGADDGR